MAWERVISISERAYNPAYYACSLFERRHAGPLLGGGLDATMDWPGTSETRGGHQAHLSLAGPYGERFELVPGFGGVALLLHRGRVTCHRSVQRQTRREEGGRHPTGLGKLGSAASVAMPRRETDVLAEPACQCFEGSFWGEKERERERESRHGAEERTDGWCSELRRQNLVGAVRALPCLAVCVSGTATILVSGPVNTALAGARTRTCGASGAE